MADGQITTTEIEFSTAEKEAEFDDVDFNNIFERLEAIRLKHNIGDAVADKFKTSIVAAETRGEGEEPDDSTSPHNLLKSYLSKLRTSSLISGVVKEEEINNIQVPEVNDLISGKNYQDILNIVKRMEDANACTNCHGGLKSRENYDNSANHVTVRDTYVVTSGWIRYNVDTGEIVAGPAEKKGQYINCYKGSSSRDRTAYRNGYPGCSKYNEKDNGDYAEYTLSDYDQLYLDATSGKWKTCLDSESYSYSGSKSDCRSLNKYKQITKASVRDGSQCGEEYPVTVKTIVTSNGGLGAGWTCGWVYNV